MRLFDPTPRAGRRACLLFVFGASLLSLSAEPIGFSIREQPVGSALLQFAKQAHVEVLYSAEHVQDRRSQPVEGQLEPMEAIRILLSDTGLSPEATRRGGFLVKPSSAPALAVKKPPAAGPTPPVVDETQELEEMEVMGEMNRTSAEELDAMAVGPRSATSNLDLPRSEDGALPFTLYRRRQINRSGVINLNEFLRREMLDGDVVGKAPPSVGGLAGFVDGMSHFGMRGFSPDETVILINGRRLPEVVASGGSPMPPDVNFIPLSLVQQVEVLPSSASAIYGGNPVGGVVNIITRPDAFASATEVSATYTNATGGYDAPQTAFSLLHGRSFLGGKLRTRFALNRTQTEPPTEAELGYRDLIPEPPVVGGVLFGATPNIRSATNTGLLGEGTSPFTSVAPGATGVDTLTAFQGRIGVRSTMDFDGPGGMAASIESRDYAYGVREEKRSALAAVTYDVTPWLQIGFDGTHSASILNRGMEAVSSDLLVPAEAPTNPFGQDVRVSLIEALDKLGEDYSEAKLKFNSAVFGILLRPGNGWRISGDVQYAHNTAEVRGVSSVDEDRWEQLILQGRYNPFRDTQANPAPDVLYDEVLTYRGGRGKFVKVGDYNTIDLAGRITQTQLDLPMGRSVFNIGGDYRRNHLDAYSEQARYSNGDPYKDPIEWSGRTLQRYSVFGEWQGPIVPTRWLPGFINAVEADLAVRYIASDISNESNVAPTLAMKVSFAGGFAARGSVTHSNRFPSPYMSRRVIKPLSSAGPGLVYVSVYDQRRNETYNTLSTLYLDPDLKPEGSVTQSFGLSWEHGKHQRFRFSADLIDTRKENELVMLDEKAVMNLESLFPERVIRGAPDPTDGNLPGRITNIFTGTTNLSRRNSQSVHLSALYRWDDCFGGVLEAYGRSVSFLGYKRQNTPTSPMVDELTDPTGVVSGLLRHRASFGLSWADTMRGFGFDGYYYHSWKLPEGERNNQKSSQVDPFWQFDIFAHQELGQWLPIKNDRFGLRLQARISNVLGTEYPRYANDSYGSGVQAYGDWRGRTYSLSLVASF